MAMSKAYRVLEGSEVAGFVYMAESHRLVTLGSNNGSTTVNPRYKELIETEASARYKADFVI